MKKGLMLTNAMLSSQKELSMFRYGVETLGKYDIQLIEYYTKEEQLAKEYGKIIRERGYIGIFHSALDQKRSGWCRLCSEEEPLRKKSVDFSKWTIDKAVSSGSIRAVIQSGTYPEDPSKEAACWEALAKSLEELSTFVGKDIQLGIEPCDRSLDVRQLIGPAMATYTFIKNLNKDNIILTLDTAHIALTFEDVVETVRLCKPFCDHIHVANCVVDPSVELYGDKHPLFGYPGSVFSDEEAQAMYQKIVDVYAGQDLYISPEMICREKDEKAYFEKMLNSMPWFFQKI